MPLGATSSATDEDQKDEYGLEPATPHKESDDYGLEPATPAAAAPKPEKPEPVGAPSVKPPSKAAGIAREGALGLSSGITGMPESEHPIKDFFSSLADQGKDMYQHPIRTAASFFDPTLAVRTIGAPIAHAIGEIAPAVMYPGYLQKHPEEVAHGVGSAIGQVLQMRGIPELADSRIARGASKRVFGSETPIRDRLNTPPVAPGLSDEAVKNLKQPVARRGVEKVFQAAEPAGGNIDFREKLAIAAPDIADIERSAPLENSRKSGGLINPDFRIREFVTNAYKKLDDIWNEQRRPQIDRHRDEAVMGRSELVPNAEPGEIDKIAKKLNIDLPQQITLGDADDILKQVNAQLRGIEGKDPQSHAKALAVSPILDRLNTMKGILHDRIGKLLEARGEPGIKDFNMRYGALSEVADQFRDRMNPAEAARALNDVRANIRDKGIGLLQRLHIEPSPGRRLEKGLKALGQSDLTAPPNPQPPPVFSGPGTVGGHPRITPFDAPVEPTPMRGGLWPETAPEPASLTWGKFPVKPMTPPAGPPPFIAPEGAPQAPPNVSGEAVSLNGNPEALGSTGRAGTRFAPKALLPAPRPAPPVGVLPTLAGPVTAPMWGRPVTQMRPGWDLPNAELLGPWGGTPTEGPQIGTIQPPPARRAPLNVPEKKGVQEGLEFGEKPNVPRGTSEPTAKPVEKQEVPAKEQAIVAKVEDAGLNVKRSPQNGRVSTDAGVLSIESPEKPGATINITEEKLNSFKSAEELKAFVDQQLASKGPIVSGTSAEIFKKLFNKERPNVEEKPQIGQVGEQRQGDRRAPESAAVPPPAVPERRVAQRRGIADMLGPMDESLRLNSYYDRIIENADGRSTPDDIAKATRAKAETEPGMIGGGGEETAREIREARAKTIGKPISMEEALKNQAERAGGGKPQIGIIPGMEEHVARQNEGAARVRGEDLTREANTPKSIEAGAGEMERNSPLFRGTDASPQKEIFGNAPPKIGNIQAERPGMLVPPEPSKVSDRPAPPPGKRWFSDRGAMPGEPSMLLDVPKSGDLGQAKAAIIEREVEGQPGQARYELVAPGGDTLGVFGTPGEAAKFAETKFPGAKPAGADLPVLKREKPLSDEMVSAAESLRRKDSKIGRERSDASESSYNLTPEEMKVAEAEGLVRSEVGMMQAGDRPGRYYMENEPGDYNSQNIQSASGGVTSGGHWQGIPSLRPHLSFMREHPEFNPKAVENALLLGPKSRMYQRVIAKAIEFLEVKKPTEESPF